MPAASPLSSVNFSGNWLLDARASDSLEPLLAYHGHARTTPVAALGLGAAAPQTDASRHNNTTTTSATTSDGGHTRQHTGSHSLTLTSVTEADESRSRANSSQQSTSRHSSSSSSSASSSAAPSVPPSPSSSTPGSQRASDASLASLAIPALIIQHSSRRLITYLHGLIPRYDTHTGVLLRYDPLDPTGKQALTPYEEYKLDGEYHWLTTAHGRVEARAYTAPHGQSVLVDTRCASKYDLERTERFLEKDGQQLVVEVRILSCDPTIQPPRSGVSATGVATKFAPTNARSPHQARQVAPTRVTPGQVVVKELLFLRRVFTKIVDADPDREAKEQREKEEANEKRRIAAAAAASAAAATAAASPLSGASGLGSGEQLSTGLLDFNSSETVNHSSPVKVVGGGGGGGSSGASAASGSGGHFLPPASATFSPAAQAILPRDLTRSTKYTELEQPDQPGEDPNASWWTRACTMLLYPRVVLLRRYDITELVDGGKVGGGGSGGDPALRASFLQAAAVEREAYAKTRKQMMLVDLLLVAVILWVILGALGVLPKLQMSSLEEGRPQQQVEALASTVVDSAEAAAAAVQQFVATTITPAVPPDQHLMREL